MSPPAHDATIVICTRDRPACISRLLDSLAAQDFQGFAVYVVDDGSEPPIDVSGRDVRLIRHDASQSYIRSRNEGTLAANTEYVIHFDDDVELRDPTLVRRVVELARAHPECGAIGMKQVLPDGTDSDIQPSYAQTPSYAGNFFGYGFLVATGVFRDLGGFDEQFGFYFEEIEYCLRLRNAGYEVLFDPSLRVVHHYDPTGRRDVRRTQRLVALNAMRTVVRNFPLWAVPPAAVKVLVNHIRMCRVQNVSDWKGLPWIMGQLLGTLRGTLKNRRSMPFSKILETRRLRRNPLPLSRSAEVFLQRL